MESGLKNVEAYYYMGALQMVYADYTKDPNNPYVKFIRWEK